MIPITPVFAYNQYSPGKEAPPLQMIPYDYSDMYLNADQYLHQGWTFDPHRMVDGGNHLIPQYMTPYLTQWTIPLPDTVATRILEILFDDVGRRCRSTPEFPGFLRVTQVCSQWRRIAKAEPKFWRYIHLGGEDLTLLCLSRCGTLPLIVTAHTKADDESEEEGTETDDDQGDEEQEGGGGNHLQRITRRALDALLPFTNSIQTLHITSSASEMDDLVAVFHGRPFNALQSLYLRYSPPDYESDEEGEMDDHLELEFDIHRSSKPKLIKMDVKDMTIPWTSCLLTGGNLTSLSLYKTSLWGPPTQDTFLCSLHLISSLTHLELTNTTPVLLASPPHPIPIPESHKPHLPLLRTFLLTTHNQHDIYHILDTIICPVSTRYNLTASFSPNHTILPDMIPPHHPLLIVLREESDIPIALMADQSLKDPPDSDSESERRLSLFQGTWGTPGETDCRNFITIRGFYHDEDERKALSDIAHLLSGSKTTSLALSSSHHLSTNGTHSPHYHAILSSFPDLRTLDFRGVVQLGYIAAMIDYPDLCPVLEDLALDWVQPVDNANPANLDTSSSRSRESPNAPNGCGIHGTC